MATTKALDEDGVVLLASDIKTLSDATYPSNAAIASAYDSTAAYSVGDYCLRNGLLYKCNTAIGTGGETWTAAHWTQTKVSDEFGAGGSPYDSDIIADEYDSSSAYSIGDYCVYDDLLYKCNTAIGSGGEAWNSAHWTQTNVVGEITAVLTKLAFTNVVVASSAFVSDVTYNEFPYKASIALTNVTSSMLPEVVFSTSDAISGIFSPVVESYNGGVYIYSSDIPSGASITIPSILCTVV